MQALIDTGVAFIIALQGLGDWFIIPMQFFSQLGTEDFFFLILPLTYWSIDSALGMRVAFILITSDVLNFTAKLLFAGPRPFWASSHVRAFWSETSFGIPSGHAQHAMSVWGMIAVIQKQTWVRVLSIVLIVMIGVSRIFLGTHFPHDVLMGWLLGGLLLWAFVRFEAPVVAWVKGKSFRQQVGAAFFVSMLIIALGMTVVAVRSDYQVPESWINNALLAGTEMPHPVDPNGIFTSAGTFFGLALGLAWIQSLGGYQASGPVWRRALCFVIGLIGVLILWMGLGAVFPRGEDILVYVLRFVRYTLVGWWVAGGAPWVFQHFNLTTSSVSKPTI